MKKQIINKKYIKSIIEKDIIIGPINTINLKNIKDEEDKIYIFNTLLYILKENNLITNKNYDWCRKYIDNINSINVPYSYRKYIRISKYSDVKFDNYNVGKISFTEVSDPFFDDDMELIGEINYENILMEKTLIEISEELNIKC